MKLIRGLHGIAPEHRGNVMTIGNFDGVHHGHLKLLDDLVAKGVELERPTLLMTFEPQPREFFRGREVPPVLLSGNHEAVRRFRLEESVEVTRNRRPDLFSTFAGQGAMASKPNPATKEKTS